MSNNEQDITHVHRIMITLLAIFVFGMLNSQAAHAKTLRCAIMQSKPFGFMTEDGQMTGIHYDTMKRIAEEAGFTFAAEIAPFARIIEQLKNGYADLAMMYRNERIEEAAVIVGPTVRTDRIVIFGRKGVDYTSSEALHGKVVAHLRGAHYDDALAADEAIKKYYTTSYQQSLDMFLKKRVDAIVAPEYGLLFEAKSNGMPLDMFGEPLVLNIKTTYLFLSKKTMDDETLKILRITLDRLRKMGVTNEIKSKYVRLLHSE